MRKFAAFLILVITFEAGFFFSTQVVNAEAKSLVCSSTAICFSQSEDMLPFQAFQGNITRNVCHNLDRPNATGYIDNNTGTQWRVFTGPNCTETVGPIYAHTEAPMLDIFRYTIESVYRTSAK